MRNGKYSKSTGFKTTALLLAMVLLVGCAIGGTLAWLTAQTEPVTNTFTTSNIGITLAETETDFKMVPGWTIKKDPIVTVKKGSEDCYLFVQVEKSCGVNGKNFDDYIACNLETNRNVNDINVWEKLDNVDNVYYIKVTADEVKDNDKVIHLLLAGSCTDPMGTSDKQDDDVTVSWNEDHVATKPSVTKEMMEAIDGVDSNGKTDTEAAKAEVDARPSISFTAYASQLYKTNKPGSGATAEQIADAQFTPAEAWANVNPSNP